MRNSIIALFFAALFLSACGRQTNEYRVSDSEEIRAVANSYEISLDGTWNPSRLDRKEFEVAIRREIERRRIEEKNAWILDSLTYIENNLQKYTVEYGGIKKDGASVIFCLMHLLGELDPDRKQGNHFSRINDGGASVAVAIFDPTTNSISLFGWHGG